MTIRLCPCCKRPLKANSKKTSIKAVRGRPYQKEYFKHKKIAKIIALREIEHQMTQKTKRNI